MNSRRILLLGLACLCLAGGAFVYWQRSALVAKPALEFPTGKQIADGSKAKEGVSPAQAEGQVQGTMPSEQQAGSPLWSRTFVIEGEKIDQSSLAFVTARLQGRVPEGRIMSFTEKGGRDLAQLKRGERVVIPLPDGEMSGVVNLVQTTAEGVVRVGGGLDNDQGGFSLTQSKGVMAGRVLLKQQQLAYLVSTSTPGKIRVRELALSDVMCYPLPRAEREDPQAVPRDAQPDAAPPEHRSRPDATAVLYLDFDGATVTDPDWNDGTTINAAASTLLGYEITQVFHRVAEDFAPFNINVTTLESDYLNAPVGRRMRVIITPTDSWYGDAGGVAYRDTFAAAGTQGFSNDVPCWVFNGSVNGIAEAVSHELGHTLGLKHDGRTSPQEEYYDGHGSGGISWGPIMGASYDRNVIQWSEGEYTGANNLEDDLAIIAGLETTPLYGKTNNTGMVSDDAGDTTGTAVSTDISSGAFAVNGLISSVGDSDYYSFSLTSPKVLTLTASPATFTTKQANLDIALHLLDSGGNLLAQSNHTEALNASINQALGVGNYYLRIAGSGAGNPTANPASGYTAYGSIGQYTVNATAVAVVAPSFYQQPLSKTVTAGQLVEFYAPASGNPSPNYQWQRFPAGGANWENLADGAVYQGSTTNFLSFTGNTPMSGDLFRCVASNLGGSSTSIVVTLTVNPAVAPTISGLPSTLTVPYGQGMSLYPSISGTQPMTYQWKKDGVVIPGATSSSYYVGSGMTPADSGVYTLTATNFGGATTSSGVTVTVSAAVAPTISGLTANVTVAYGDSLSLYPSISGTQPMTYQWKKDGVAILGATGYSYYKNGMTTADSGVYTVTATNLVGSTTSANVTVTVNAALAPTIYNLPATVTVPYGNSLSLYPSISGTQPMTFQWKKNGVNILGATSYSYYKGEMTTADSGVYTLTATNLVGSTTSSNVTVTVNAAVAPAIYNLPATVTVAYAESMSLYPSITGTQPMTFQWKKDGVDIFGATNSYYGKSAMTPADSGVYTLTATNQVGSTTSSNVTVTVNAAVAPVIYNLPEIVSAAYGESLNLSASILGTQPMTFQWKKDGVVIPGATSSYYYKSGLTTADSGVYTLTATNQVGATTSDGVSVSVSAAFAPVIYNLPATVTVAYGNNISLYPSITGTQPITYQWKKGGVAIPGATGSSYYKSGMTTADSGVYTLTATNQVGSTTSEEVTVTVNSAVAPAISSLPATLTVAYGEGFNLYPSITGTQPMTYQWKKDGINISGATYSSYGKNEVTTADSGVYTLTATNQVGSTTSSNVTVTVNAPVAPMIYNLPSTVTLTYGQNIYLYPSITGTQPMTYQWKKDGVNIEGATNFSYYKNGMTTADSGVYTLTATNQVGSTTGEEVTVSVTSAVAPTITGLAGTVTVAYGESLSLYPSVSGTQPMTYQWKKDGLDIPGAIYSSYGKSGMTTADSGVYTLTATNLVDSTTSSNVTVTVSAPVAPVISGLPSVVLVAYGNNLNLYPSISGTQPMTYQWKKDGLDIPGAIYSSYGKSVMTAEDSGGYTLTATNQVGSTTSTSVTVTVNVALAPTITGLPATVSVAYGETLNLYASVTGTQPMTFQWKKDGVNLPGATGTSYYKSGMTLAGSGVYTLTATNLVGSTTSANVTVTVSAAEAPAITGLPATVTVPYGEPLSLYPSITGTQPMTYQWKKDGINIAGATGSSFYKSGMTSAGSGTYTLTATNQAGSTTSANVVVTVSAAVAPTITGLSPTMTVAYGEGLGLYPTITGTQPMTYQWKKDGVDIPGATNSWLGKSGMTTADSGAYTLTATNQVGSTTSTNVVVTVSAAVAPIITGLPATVTVAYGELLSLSPTITGTQPITYQWKRNGVNIPGATGSWYYKYGMTATGDGVYTLTATNQVGSTTSAEVTVTVSAPVAPTITGLPATVTVPYGQLLNLNPTITGTQPMTYQWKKDGVDIPGATSSGYWSAMTLVGSEVYTLTATNQVGSTTSEGVTVTVNPIPTTFVLSATSLAYTGGAQGPTVIPTPAGATFTTGGTLSATSVGSYTATATANGNYTGTNTTLTWNITKANQAAPTISSAASFTFGGSYTATATGSGFGALEWALGTGSTANGAAINASTGAVTCSAPGTVVIKVRFAGDASHNVSDYTSDFLVAVNSAPVITLQPANQSRTSGQSAQFTIAATGNPAVSYQWQYGSGNTWQNLTDEAEWSGTTTTTLTIAAWAVSALDGIQFRCLVSNSEGTVTSNAALLTIRNIIGHDFNGDGQPDILWRNSTTGELAVWFMDGSTRLYSIALGTSSIAWTTAGVGDFNGDGQPDILWRNNTTGELAVWFMDGSTRLYSIALGTSSIAWTTAGVGDFNGDGQPDILWRNNTTGELAVWFMDGSTRLYSIALGTSSIAWATAGVGDFNGDGQPDILWRNNTTGELAVWIMNGSTRQYSLSLGTSSPFWKTAGTGDFNGDGYIDVLWRNPTSGELAVWMMQGYVRLYSISLGTSSPAWQVAGDGQPN